jgi:NADH:ubiquinone oxidoreductase subunit E/NAD-dependent dihydropyrimidine dehydrogenase PreA subunit
MAGLNPYQCEIANIREQCSWVHPEKSVATPKASRIAKATVEKVRYNESVDPISVSLTKKALVIGGGIAGIQASLDIANSGHDVVLVEKTPSIGGHMAQLSETFPTLDCSQCILTPRMVEVSQHPKIELLTYSEIEDISGYAGNFKVKIRKNPRYVNMEKCTSCGDCMTACPVRNVPEIQAPPEYGKGIEAKERKRLDAILTRYSASPPPKEMLIQILQDVNDEYNYLPEFALKYVSERVEIPLAQVYHTATFYTAFSLEPRGEHLIKVCMGTACHTRGALRVLEELERRLEVKAGETTEDLLFTLETVNCLGCCALAPVVVVDEDYHAGMAPSKVEKMLSHYRGKGK